LQRQADVAEGIHKGLIAQVQQSNIDAFNSYPNIQELNAPVVESSPASPKLSLVAINALLAAIVGSFALLLLLESRNPLLDSKHLQPFKFPLVTQIPYTKRIASASNLIAEGEVRFRFQTLASAIGLHLPRHTRLLVTSATTGEGKTSISLGLASALTDLGFRVLLVDGDFRKADLSRRLGHTQKRAHESEVVKLQHNLDFLPTMPQQGNIVDLVAQGRFERYLAKAEADRNYDYVLVDSAPIGLTSETAVMSTIVPQVLFVVRPGISTRNTVNDSFDRLAQHKAQVIGLVVNGVKDRSGSYSYSTDLTLITSS
jgi:polysaccharide biosynthesis transport protein